MGMFVERNNWKGKDEGRKKMRKIMNMELIFRRQIRQHRSFSFCYNKLAFFLFNALAVIENVS